VIVEIATGAEDNQRRCPRERNRFTANSGRSYDDYVGALAEDPEQCAISALREALG
jgi:hypothetical protein